MKKNNIIASFDIKKAILKNKGVTMKAMLVLVSVMLVASMAWGDGGCPHSVPICLKLKQPLTITNTSSNDSFTVNDESGDTSPFVIDADGNVGIGTGSPTSKLMVAGDISLPFGNQIIFAGLADTFITYKYIKTESQLGYTIESFHATPANTKIIFKTSSAEQVRIDDTGQLGIGTDTPDEKLEVNGNIYLQDNDKSLYGTSKDAEIYFNATNLIIDPDAVDTGKVYIGVTGDDTINAGAYEVAGVAGLSATYTFGGGGTGDIATMTFTSGILTAVTTVP